MSNVFDYVNSVNFNKKNLMDGSNTEQAEKEYVAFIVNKSLSYFPDSILYAQEMNTSGVDNKLQYDYLLHALPSRKRFSKWFKKEKNEELVQLAKFLNISITKTEELYKVLKTEDIQRLITLMNSTGGC